MRLRRPLYGPQHPRGPSRGRDVRDFVKRTLHRMPGQIAVGDGFFLKPPGGFDDVYNAKTARAVRIVQRWNEISETGNVDQETLDAFWQYADGYSKWVYRLYVPPRPKPSVPALGPVYPGGASVLFHSLTHETAGIPGYPAFDDGWRAGRAVLAPEDLVVTEQSGSQGGDAFFARGASGLRYWFGHLAWAPPTGKAFRKGQTLGVIAALSASQGGPHVHLGIDARGLIGRELEHKTNYQPGAPSVGEQLRKALA